MIEHRQLYIDGHWVAAQGRGRIDVHSPADASLLARIPEGQVGDVDAAVSAARNAFERWSSTPVAQRADLLRAVQELLKARTDELAELITREMGMPIKLSQRVQVGSPAAIFGLCARLLPGLVLEERVGNSKVVREAVGVVAAITPWNYPLHQVAAKVAAALAAGCTVVLKPSEVAPLSAFVLARIFDEVGLPRGVFNLVSGYGPVVGEALAAHPGVDMVSFTGSTRAGRRVSELAAASIKRVSLELGGKSAAIVLDDADLDSAVRGVVANCFMNAGQTCNAHTRLLVSEARYEEAARIAVSAAAAFVPGDPMDPATTLGPLASAAQLERVRGYIRSGLESGARLLSGGAEHPAGVHAAGYFVAPTVFGRVAPESRLAREEVFGPVLAIMTYRDEQDAIRIANDSEYGLSGGVWSASDERAERVARRLRTGQVTINGGPFNLQAPFGGYRQSGHGRELGRYGIEEFLEYKAMQFRALSTPS